MIVIGVDQSFRQCAFVVMETGTHSVVASGIAKKVEGKDNFFNSFFIAEALGIAVKEHQPALVVLEGLSFGDMGNVTRDLAGLQYVIITHLKYRIMHDDITIVPPPTLKKFATGSGRADKALMIQHLPDTVKELFMKAGYKKTTGLSDLADAYWLAKFGCDSTSWINNPT